MSEQFITYFGYGSLVNRETRPPTERSFPARLYGWRRVWGHRVQGSVDASTGARRSCCSLSIERVNTEPVSMKTADVQNGSKAKPDSAYIDGVIVQLPIEDLPVLDQREHGYDRIKINSNAFDLPEGYSAEHIHVYVSDANHAGRANDQFPILQSYIDCVAAGYCAVFDQQGMQHFVDSTSGWNGVIENERDAPRYPRAVSLPGSQLTQIDALVNKRRLRLDD